MPNNQNYSGTAYLAAVAAAEDKCEVETNEWIEHAEGERFPQAIDLLGRTLALVEAAACCYWGCKNPSHDLERLAGRIYNLATGALRLMRAGRYDEALSLIRSVGEFANILMLFSITPETRKEWSSFDERKRREAFKPFKVRAAINAKNVPPAMDSDEYADLCEQAVHPNPSTAPSGYNTPRVPVLGGHLQHAGAIMVMCAPFAAVGSLSRDSFAAALFAGG